MLGSGYPEGGGQEMALAMCEAVEARGGAIYVRCPVEAIVLDSAGAAVGVSLSGGRIVRAKRVISGLGWRKTMALLPEGTAPTRPLVTHQSCGFVLANLTLHGTAEELGISSANTWIQPSSAENNWDAIAGIDACIESPLGVDPRHLALGITFPSCKDVVHSAKHPNLQTCQILAPAEWRHFARFQPAGTQAAARHAPPHAEREARLTLSLRRSIVLDVV